MDNPTCKKRTKYLAVFLFSFIFLFSLVFGIRPKTFPPTGPFSFVPEGQPTNRRALHGLATLALDGKFQKTKDRALRVDFSSFSPPAAVGETGWHGLIAQG